jgi:hypothetical protein
LGDLRNCVWGVETDLGATPARNENGLPEGKPLIVMVVEYTTVSNCAFTLLRVAAEMGGRVSARDSSDALADSVRGHARWSIR